RHRAREQAKLNTKILTGREVSAKLLAALERSDDRFLVRLGVAVVGVSNEKNLERGALGHCAAKIMPPAPRVIPGGHPASRSDVGIAFTLGRFHCLGRRAIPTLATLARDDRGGYSALNATVGSMPVARRAGTYVASSATAPSTN